MFGREAYISVESLRQVIHLLSSTEMSVVEIAEQMSISKNTIIAINRRFQVRKYSGPGASLLPALEKKKPA
jgi:IS30 family transposase